MNTYENKDPLYTPKLERIWMATKKDV